MKFDLISKFFVIILIFFLFHMADDYPKVNKTRTDILKPKPIIPQDSTQTNEKSFYDKYPHLYFNLFQDPI